jgi:predicted transposase YdaD
MSKDETLRSLEMLHQKYEWDVASRIAGARKEGLAEGEERGEARGHHEGTLQVARAALSEGASVDFIERITGLDAEAIRRLREN